MQIRTVHIVRSFGHRQIYDNYNRTKEGAITVEYIVMDMEWNTRFDREEIIMLKLFDIVTLRNDDPKTGINAGKTQFIFRKTSHYNEIWCECAGSG